MDETNDALVALFLAKLKAAAEVFHQKEDDAKTEGEKLALCAVLDLLRAVDGVDRTIVGAPFYQMLSDLEKTARNERELTEVARLAFAAGAVDVLHYSCGMRFPEAVAAVARKARLDGAALARFRRNVRTGRVTGGKFYERFVAAAKAHNLPASEKKKAALDHVAALFQGKPK